MANDVFVIEEMTYDGIARKYKPAPGGKLFRWSSTAQSSPVVGWPYEHVLRTIREDYAGGAEPIEQILGSNYEPFTLSGRWNDRYNDPGFAKRTRDDMDELVKSGSPVRVSWADIVFIGLLRRFRPMVMKEWLCDYEIEISPHLRGDDPGRSIESDKVASVRNYGDLILQVSSEMQTVHALAPVRYITGTLHSSVSLLVTTVSDKAVQISAVIEGRVLSFNEDEINSVSKVVADLEIIRQAALSIRSALSSASTTTSIYFPDTLVELEFDAWSRGLGIQARSLAVIAREAAEELSRRVIPSAQALYRPRAGESYYDIANQFFGSPADWRVISEANPEIFAMEFDGTELLVIPSRR